MVSCRPGFESRWGDLHFTWTTHYLIPGYFPLQRLLGAAELIFVPKTEEIPVKNLAHSAPSTLVAVFHACGFVGRWCVYC